MNIDAQGRTLDKCLGCTRNSTRQFDLEKMQMNIDRTMHVCTQYLGKSLLTSRFVDTVERPSRAAIDPTNRHGRFDPFLLLQLQVEHSQDCVVNWKNQPMGLLYRFWYCSTIMFQIKFRSAIVKSLPSLSKNPCRKVWNWSQEHYYIRENSLFYSVNKNN